MGRSSLFASLLLLSSALAPAYAAKHDKRDLEPPLDLEHDWEYQGCYIDVPGRTINKAVKSDGQMTNEMCTQFCFDNNYSYAGTEYYGECYCGDKLRSGGVEARATDCNTPCNGDPSQPCGGPDRLTLYKKPYTGPVTNPGLPDWPSAGCYAEGKTGRALTYGMFAVPAGEMTVAKCIRGCADAGFKLAGVEYAGECFCGDEISNGGEPATEGCDMFCHGNHTEWCGGSNRLNLYDYKLQYTGDDTTSSSTTTTTTTTTTAAATTSSVSTHTSTASESSTSISTASSSSVASTSSHSTTSSLSAAASDSSSSAASSSSASTSSSESTSSASTSTSVSTSTPASTSTPGSTSTTESSTASTSASTSAASTSTLASTTTSTSASSTASTTTSTTPLSAQATTSGSASTSTPASTSESTSTSASTSTSVSTSTSASTSTPATTSTSASTSTPATTSTSASTSTPATTSTSASTSTPATTSTSASTSTSVSTSTPATTSTSVSTSTPATTSTSATTSTPATTSTSASTSASASTSTPATTSTSVSTSTPETVSTSTIETTTSSIVALETTSTTSMAEETPTPIVCPYQPETVAGWDYHGCYTEATGMRALSAKTFGSYELTLAACAEFCAGYTYFGVEYSWECYCGNKFNTGSVETLDSECNMLCGGEDCNFCGAGNRLSVYIAGDAPPPSETEAEPEPNPTPTNPVPTDIPDGWDYYGCWVDGAQGRILGAQAPDQPDLTLASCIDMCADRGFTVAGAQYYTQCFCGNEIINGGEVASSESQCSTPCGGNPDEFCGGPNRMTIYSIGEPRVYGPPAPVQNVGDWTYQGCALDNVDDKRTFPWQLILNSQTPEECLDSCAEFGYMAAGLEYGIECYCGDPANIDTAGSEFVDDDQCNIPCAGNSSAICGGGARLSTYFWEGDPFYTWDIPEAGSPEAGSYEFLIGGVTIPLMTSQAINGKVTFLEKWGTGPPNSTGAYELDLTEIDNWELAWREMHVQTDLFCAAGVTLPDKAGRQLTVGGWSGDSTYGVRLYTPDGSDGVHGVNDWEENVDILSLQDGRWYPSTLNMANGSILVVGGEEGSNAAPVPTLEILPYTGTAPLYMEWLERTDPNNLYPFLAVLPSGGIFVAYWNEARILDEDTFETIRTLPNMPGAVNDPMGGRTYPLEGTAVLLPQYAPFTAPLGVLICGGSTGGIGHALDNCVSTFPDAAEPEWTIERMPSKRVISCMSPLPDGTFLVLNGAMQGVAGFGLAINPNLNALLYDPRKDVHSRFTVMANTTVARMYHSEAITLLDGRVLVSGSDPQDGQNPQEYRVETFTPPYLKSGKPRPTFELSSTDWAYNAQVTFELGSAAQNGAIEVSLLGSVSSTHGNSMGTRTLFPAVTCGGTTCTVTAPPGKYVCPPGWYQFFVLDGGIPAVGVFVRIGGDPGEIGNWPEGEGFTRPGI